MPNKTCNKTYFALEFASQIKCRERLKQSQCILAAPFVQSVFVSSQQFESDGHTLDFFTEGHKEEASDLEHKNGNDGMEATDERLQNG